MQTINKKSKILLAIETSCDETSLAIIRVQKDKKGARFTILAHQTASQIALHQQYGGVFPMMAKREHAKNIVPLFISTLKEAKFFKKNKVSENIQIEKLQKALIKESELLAIFVKEIPQLDRPPIDTIVVTSGPGLEPALWVGINFAKALSLTWKIPVVPVNHMEGHVFSIFPKEGKKNFTINKQKFPSITLLVSGGHTELVLMKDFMKYKIIGSTRDDAAGEAFDKVARMLELPYPGGPEISKLAASSRAKKMIAEYGLRRGEFLPRPMMKTDDFDFSFSGLKTAVLYLIKNLKTQSKEVSGQELLSDAVKEIIAEEFENAVVDVLTYKTIRALQKYKAKTLIIGGGVAANKELRSRLAKEIKSLKKTLIYFPSKKLTGDNALMIGIAGYFRLLQYKKGVPLNKIKAQGNLSLK